MNPIPVKDRIRCATCRPFLVKFSSLDVGAYRIRPTNAYVNRQMIQPPGTCLGVFDTPLPIRDKSLINTCLLNPILDKDLISYSNSLHITTHFWCTSVGAYRIRPTNAYVHRQMIQPPGTCWGVCFCALPIRIKNLIPVYWMNLKPGGFWGACLCGQPHPGERPLKFVWMYAKPGGDETDMAIFTKNPAGIGRIWPYLPKTRRELDEYGHICRKPGGDRTQYGHSYRILAVDRTLYVFGNHIFGKDGIRVITCGLYLFYIGRQMARTGADVSRQECRATRGMRSAVCVRQFFTLRFPSLAHSPSPSYC